MQYRLRTLLILLAKATDRELARMVSYLKEENRILRAGLPEKINRFAARIVGN